MLSSVYYYTYYNYKFSRFLERKFCLVVGLWHYSAYDDGLQASWIWVLDFMFLFSSIDESFVAQIIRVHSTKNGIINNIQLS